SGDRVDVVIARDGDAAECPIGSDVEYSQGLGRARRTVHSDGAASEALLALCRRRIGDIDERMEAVGVPTGRESIDSKWGFGVAFPLFANAARAERYLVVALLLTLLAQVEVMRGGVDHDFGSVGVASGRGSDEEWREQLDHGVSLARLPTRDHASGVSTIRI